MVFPRGGGGALPNEFLVTWCHYIIDKLCGYSFEEKYIKFRQLIYLPFLIFRYNVRYHIGDKLTEETMLLPKIGSIV